MTKQNKRFFIWTSLTFAAGLCVGGGFKATLDVLATRHSWHLGGEIFALGAIIALPLVWLWGVKLGSAARDRVKPIDVCREVARGVLMGGVMNWRSGKEDYR